MADTDTQVLMLTARACTLQFVCLFTGKQDLQANSRAFLSSNMVRSGVMCRVNTAY